MKKCDAYILVKDKTGKKYKKRCNNEIGTHDIFCSKCGKPTDALSTKLSAKQNIDEVWHTFYPQKGKYFPFSILMVFTAFLLILLSYIFKSQVADMIHLNTYFTENILYLITVPLALIPFASDENFLKNPLTIDKYIKNLKQYPKMLIFVFLNILYLFLLNITCTGYLLNIMTDPILHIVRFIMVQYWFVVVLPAPFLILRKNINPIKAIIMSYKASAETRWQQYFILLYILLANVIGAVSLIAGLLVSIPLSYILIEKYYSKMEEYELFNQ